MYSAGFSRDSLIKINMELSGSGGLWMILQENMSLKLNSSVRFVNCNVGAQQAGVSTDDKRPDKSKKLTFHCLYQ